MQLKPLEASGWGGGHGVCVFYVLLVHVWWFGSVLGVGELLCWHKNLGGILVDSMAFWDRGYYFTFAHH